MGPSASWAPFKMAGFFQAKGQDFSLVELLGGQEDLAAAYQDGLFATVYLSPKDYHRAHAAGWAVAAHGAHSRRFVFC